MTTSKSTRTAVELSTSPTSLDLTLQAFRVAQSRLPAGPDGPHVADYAARLVEKVRSVFNLGPAHVETAVGELSDLCEELRARTTSPAEFDLAVVTHLDECYRQIMLVGLERFPTAIRRHDGKRLVIKQITLTPRVFLGASARAASGQLLRTIATGEPTAQLQYAPEPSAMGHSGTGLNTVLMGVVVGAVLGGLARHVLPRGNGSHKPFLRCTRGGTQFRGAAHL